MASTEEEDVEDEEASITSVLTSAVVEPLQAASSVRLAKTEKRTVFLIRMRGKGQIRKIIRQKSLEKSTGKRNVEIKG